MALPLLRNFPEPAARRQAQQNDAQKAKMFHTPAKIVVLEHVQQKCVSGFASGLGKSKEIEHFR
ncbi:hypothetical protein O8B93_05025 [Agrobacterium rhizogenes]|uniref:hypothetical protein n=1 Tax=Rhizobium rhizogenes TaxID=359 RepID=UPI0022B6D549|nr:hypothetical protein [Rhizobium rhizogenes]MCZ7446955.1 hypothetical protein [Rhizobium rhizogenes]